MNGNNFLNFLHKLFLWVYCNDIMSWVSLLVWLYYSFTEELMNHTESVMGVVSSKDICARSLLLVVIFHYFNNCISAYTLISVISAAV